MRALVIAEHDNNTINDSTLRCVNAASFICDDIDILLISKNSKDVLEQSKKIEKVKQVLLCEHQTFANPVAENIAETVLSIAGDYTHILAPSNTYGKNFLPRVAAKLDVSQITDVIDIISENEFKRPIYAGNVIETVSSNEAKIVMTIRVTAFDKVEYGVGGAKVKNIEPRDSKISSKFVKLVSAKSERPDLANARFVVSGGRGMASAENFQLLESFADKLGNAAIGASRAAVDAGYISNDHQVGQTGKIVAPEIYFSFGISGAIQHIAGIKDSKYVVAVNKDENAPIFESADLGIVADLFEVLPQLEKLI